MHMYWQVKKKVEKAVVEEKVSPFAQSPLMISQTTLVIRQGPAHDTPLVGANHKLLPGSLVGLVGSRNQSAMMLEMAAVLMSAPFSSAATAQRRSVNPSQRQRVARCSQPASRQLGVADRRSSVPAMLCASVTPTQNWSLQ